MPARVERYHLFVWGAQTLEYLLRVFRREQPVAAVGNDVQRAADAAVRQAGETRCEQAGEKMKRVAFQAQRIALERFPNLRFRADWSRSEISEPKWLKMIGQK
jgi:hypothetical protein